MDSDKMDGLVKDLIGGNDTFYRTEADAARERIWEKVAPPPSRNKFWLVYGLAAACILLLFISSFLAFFYFYHHHESYGLLTAEQPEVKRTDHRDSVSEKPLASLQKRDVIRDTVFIRKEKVNQVPVEITLYQTDTVFVEKIVYVPQKPDLHMAVEELKPDPNIPSAEYVISRHQESQKPVRRWQLKFGKEKSSPMENSFSLLTKYRN